MGHASSRIVRTRIHAKTDVYPFYPITLDSPDNVTLSEEGHFLGGSLEKIIERVTAEDSGPFIVDAFLFTLSTFTTPQRVLQLLELRQNLPEIEEFPSVRPTPTTFNFDLPFQGVRCPSRTYVDGATSLEDSMEQLGVRAKAGWLYMLNEGLLYSSWDTKIRQIEQKSQNNTNF